MRTIRRALAHRNTKGLTLSELLVTIAVIAIIAALAFPLANDIIAASKNNATTAQAKIIEKFTDKWTSAGYKVTDGIGVDAGYKVAYDDVNNNNVQDANEPTISRVENPTNSGNNGGAISADGPLTVTYPSVTATIINPGSGTVALSPTVVGSTVNGAAGVPYFYVDGTDLLDGLSLNSDTGVITASIGGNAWSLPAAKAEGASAMGCAITPTETVYCWGNAGPLYEGGTHQDIQPTPVPGLTGVLELASDDSHTCALRNTGEVWCWGDSAYGALGYDTSETFVAPAPVPGISNAVDISAAYYGTCAVLATGSVKCWGYGAGGQLGNGVLANSSTPVTVSGISNAVSVDGGWSHTCALLADTKVKCWGSGAGATPVYVLTSTSQAMTGFSALAIGQGFGCGIRSGNVWCWGNNTSGRLGQGGAQPPVGMEAAQVVSLSSVAEIASGNGFTCARQTSGIVKCWGSNDFGWADSDSTSISTPTLTKAGTMAVASIGAGRETVYLIPADSSVYALGKDTRWADRGPAIPWTENYNSGFARIWRTGTNVPSTTVTFDVVAEDYDTSEPLGRWTVTITIGG